MTKILALIFILSIFIFNVARSQEGDENKFGIKFSGFIKNDMAYDSRQTVSAREGHFLLWPSPEDLDPDGNDANAKSNFNMLAIQSRLSGKITGPNAFGAKTSGVLEGDFFGQADNNIDLFRLRHAFVKLTWTNTELLAGQTWNPLFVTGCFPGTVSFNTGVPFQSFSRNPQIRVTQTLGGLQLIGALLSQRDYSSRGINGPSSSYLRNSGLPDLHFQIHYTTKGTATNLLIGSGIAYKTIVPRLKSELDYVVDETVSGITAIGFAKLETQLLTFKLQGRYGENIPDVLSISGFTVKNINNSTTGELSYTPLKNTTVWGEVHTNGKDIQVGLFGGYTKNMGTKETMSSTDNAVYGLGTNIESLMRISPRVIFNSGKVRFAAELEYTNAQYGANYDVNYKPEATNSVANIRTLLSTYYFF